MMVLRALLFLTCTTTITVIAQGTILSATRYYATEAADQFFTDTVVRFEPLEMRVNVNLVVEFKPTVNVVSDGHVMIEVKLPYMSNGPVTRDTAGTDVARDRATHTGGLYLSPSTYFDAEWIEGTPAAHAVDDVQFSGSMLRIWVKEGRTLVTTKLYKVIIYAENGLKVYCGLPSPQPLFTFYTNATVAVRGSDSRAPEAPVGFSPQIGSGCDNRAACTGHGTCDYCAEQCTCDNGWGSPTDTTDFNGLAGMRADCSERTCPTGPSHGAKPSGATGGHEQAECSAAGICVRELGACECFLGFEGMACQRRSCGTFTELPCSSHGRCVAMKFLTAMGDALPLSAAGANYGTAANVLTTAWDAEAQQACVCDSSWAVGLGAGQTQVPEYFGAACESKRCPSADNPDTKRDETNCEGVTAPGGQGVGAAGNLCHVECANQGTCDYQTGFCTCKYGYYGDACQKMATAPVRR